MNPWGNVVEFVDEGGYEIDFGTTQKPLSYGDHHDKVVIPDVKRLEGNEKIAPAKGTHADAENTLSQHDVLSNNDSNTILGLENQDMNLFPGVDQANSGTQISGMFMSHVDDAIVSTPFTFDF
jgi:hypothetical protein